MEEIAKITEAGRKAYRAGLDGVSLDAQLMMEILVRTGDISMERAVCVTI